MPLHSTIAGFELKTDGTDEQAGDSIFNALGHIAFMAYLVEIRDQRDARICREIVFHRERMSNYSLELCADVSGILGRD